MMHDKGSRHSEFDLHLQSFHPFETNTKIIFCFLKHVEFAEIVQNNVLVAWDSESRFLACHFGFKLIFGNQADNAIIDLTQA